MRSPDGEIGPDASENKAEPDAPEKAEPEETEPEKAEPEVVEPEVVEPEEDEPEEDEPEAPASEAPTAPAGERKTTAVARRLRSTRGAAAVLAVLALFAVFLIPGVRTVLRQSFTRLPQESTAIYFTENPKVHGTLLEVPLTVKGVNTGVHTYGVKVWTESAAGKVDGSTTARIPTVQGVTAGIVTLPVADDAAEVWASLDGTSQVLHFRISND